MSQDWIRTSINKLIKENLGAQDVADLRGPLNSGDVLAMIVHTTRRKRADVLNSPKFEGRGWADIPPAGTPWPFPARG